MSLEQVEPLRQAFFERRSQPSPPVKVRRAGFEAQMASLPLPDNFRAESVDINSSLSGLLCSDSNENSEKIVLWLHGGAFILGSSQSYRPFAARVTQASKAQVLLLDYALAPEHVFPAALNDVLSALDWLAERYSMNDVAIGGDSAGANLALAALQKRIADDKPVPASMWLISPYLDLTHSGGSIKERAGLDPFVDGASMAPTAATYLGDTDPTDPRASPLLASAHGIPPTLIQIGSEEVLFDDAVRLRDKITAAGGHAVFQEWAGMIHVWPIFSHAIEEGGWAISQGGNFLRQRWRRVG